MWPITAGTILWYAAVSCVALPAVSAHRLGLRVGRLEGGSFVAATHHAFDRRLLGEPAVGVDAAATAADGTAGVDATAAKAASGGRRLQEPVIDLPNVGEQSYDVVNEEFTLDFNLPQTARR